MEVIWKDVNGTNGLYQVSDMGQIRRGGRILKPQARRHGYLSVWIYDGHGNRTQKSVHRIVAEAFVPNPNNLPEVNHKDERKTNNTAQNLEWCSHQQNSSYGTRGARLSKKLTNGPKSKKIAQYTTDGKLVRVFPSLQEASRSGYSAANISRCANGHKKYSHAYGYIWRYVSKDISQGRR